MEELKDTTKSFIEQSTWVFAKTYAETWPHEYIVQEKVDNDSFLKLAEHIDKFGHKEFFYKKQMIYFTYGIHTYWHMGNIINRCLNNETYQQREKEGRLPKT